jgi:type IV pilus assembly protein PilV
VLNVRRTNRSDGVEGRLQAGVGLIEVLISVVVLSFGMLGLAGLQLWNLKNNQSSLERGLAVVQSHSIIDAMHADRATAISGGFAIAMDAAVPTGTTFAQRYIASWRANLIAALGPGATGSVVCNGAQCTITIRWNDQRGTGGDSQLEIATQVQL